MNPSLAIALLAALAPWIGLYWQRRQVRQSEHDIAIRVTGLEDVNRALAAEKLEREKQIAERTSAHRSLLFESYLGEVDQRSTELDIQVLNDLSTYQVFAMIYLFRRDDLDEKEPRLSQLVADFWTAFIDRMGTRASLKMLRHDPSRSSDEEARAFVDAVDRNQKSLEKAYAAGQAIGRALHRHGALNWADGSSFDSHFVHVSKVFRGMDDVVKKIKSLPDVGPAK